MELTITEIRSEIISLEKRIMFLMEKIELNYLKIKPKAVDFGKDIVGGGTKVDRLNDYVCKKDELKHELETKTESLREYKELLKKHEETLKNDDIGGYIRYLRKDCKKQWKEIADITYYSVRQCQRLCKCD